jgi:lysophospholipase L1-like esterase
MIANDGYLDVRGVDAITVVHANATGRNVAIELYDENQSKIQAFAVVSNVTNQAVHYDSENIHTYVTVLDIPALVGETGAVYIKLRVQQDTSKEYKLDIYLGDINAESGYHWSKKYGSPEIPEGTVTLDKTSFMVSTGKNLIDTTRFENSGYSGVLFEQFGAEQNVFADYVDVSTNKTVFIRARTNGAVEGEFVRKIATYDADKTLLDADNNHVKVTKMRLFSDVVLDGANYVSGANTLVYRYDFDDSVKFAKFAAKPDYVPKKEWKNVIISYEDILDMTSPPEQYWCGISDEWRNAILDVVKKDTKTMVMIGDSLTNWGGGSDGQNGFLKIVHDKTGVLTSNEGLAGAWWQTGGGQTACAVQRVDKIIADGRKYDLYCFLMGTNAGANTDTGETSADPSTMPGAIRYCMEKLKSYDPTAQILVCLPPQRAEGNDNQEKVNEVIKKIVESYSVKTLDVYHHSGIVPNTVVSNATYLYDGLHLGDNGITALGNLLAAEIKYLLCL